MKTLAQLIDGLEVIVSGGKPEIAISDICYDSRKVRAGSLFVCLHGSIQDGHAFIGDALAAGAAAIMGETIAPEGLPVPFVRVPDSRAALAAVSSAFYDHPASRLEIIGITGTNGKTTTSFLIESILRHAGFEPGVLGTLSYKWRGKQIAASMTTPESLDLQGIFHNMASEGITHVVMEVSSHALALGRVAGLTFRVGVFTNLSQDHLDFHQSMEEYFAAKKLLFSKHLDPRSSAAVINADDEHGKKLIENGGCRAEQVGYSAGILTGPYLEQARVRVENARLGTHGISARLMTPRGSMEIESPLVGRLNLYNVLAAVAAAMALGVSPEAVVSGIRAVSEVDGRLQRVEVPDALGFQVIVDYAHTPDAMEKALECLREMMTHGRLIAVFGCGGDRDRGKRPIMGRIGAQSADLVIITSDNPRSEDPEKILDQVEAGVIDAGSVRIDPAQYEAVGKVYIRRADRRAAIELALSLARSGDCIFIGGKGHETYQIIGSTKHPFDDRLVVRDYLRRQKVQQ